MSIRSVLIAVILLTGAIMLTAGGEAELQHAKAAIETGVSPSS
jgi:hypothetical protein